MWHEEGIWLTSLDPLLVRFLIHSVTVLRWPFYLP